MDVSVISNWIDAIDRVFWPEQNSVDSTTLTHYYFSPYPAGLGNDDILKWAQLQSEVLAPFPSSFHYAYRSKQGLHLWFSASPLSGIPETAAQASLKDGKHTLSSTHYRYLQEWRDNVLVSCVALRKDADASDNTRTDESLSAQHHGWATHRQLVQTITKPWFWASASLILLAGFLIFVVGSAITSNVQLSILSNKSEELSELVGPKLSQQSTLASYISSVNFVRGAQTRHIFLPEAISIGISTLPENSNPTIQNIAWQNNQLSIEVEASNLDITQIIQSAESSERIQTANIRPHGSPNTWLLELSF